jgi:hypothetical protein
MIIDNPPALQKVLPKNRVLLLPHCLRSSQLCQARYDRDEGLVCKGCKKDCPINQLKTAAVERGFGGVCIAPGGSLAIHFVKTHRPQGVVAVACDKELEMGKQALISLDGAIPPELVLLTIPLSRDGCIDTEVDTTAVLRAINL